MHTAVLKRPSMTSAIGVVLGLALSVALSPSAQAASASDTSPRDQSCWFDLASRDSVCVETGTGLVEAVKEQTGVVLDIPDGAIIDGQVYRKAFPTSGHDNARSSTMTATAQSTTTVVATLYDDINYGGGSLVLTAPGSCGTYSFSNLGGYGWNDRASSYRAYNGCRGTAYRDNNLAGTATSTTANASSLGSMNDQASSFKVSP